MSVIYLNIYITISNKIILHVVINSFKPSHLFVTNYYIFILSDSHLIIKRINIFMKQHI